jgi:hypothetical protein
VVILTLQVSAVSYLCEQKKIDKFFAHVFFSLIVDVGKVPKGQTYKCDPNELDKCEVGDLSGMFSY